MAGGLHLSQWWVLLLLLLCVALTSHLVEVLDDSVRFLLINFDEVESEGPVVSLDQLACMPPATGTPIAMFVTATRVGLASDDDERALAGVQPL